MKFTRVPFHAGEWTWETGAGSSLTVWDGGQPNPDGSGGAVIIATSPGLGGGLALWRPFWGRGFGLRWMRPADGQILDFSVVLDGVPYPVPASDLRQSTEGNVGVTDRECYRVIADTLPDGPHHAEVVLPGHPTLPGTWTFYGFLLDRRYYRDLPRTLLPYSVKPLPVVPTAVDYGRDLAAGCRWVRKIGYTNTSPAPVAVALTLNGVVLWQASLAPGASDAWDPGGRLSIARANLKHWASAVGVNATVYGGW